MVRKHSLYGRGNIGNVRHGSWLCENSDAASETATFESGTRQAGIFVAKLRCRVNQCCVRRRFYTARVRSGPSPAGWRRVRRHHEGTFRDVGAPGFTVGAVRCRSYPRAQRPRIAISLSAPAIHAIIVRTNAVRKLRHLGFDAALGFVNSRPPPIRAWSRLCFPTALRGSSVPRARPKNVGSISRKHKAVNDVAQSRLVPVAGCCP